MKRAILVATTIGVLSWTCPHAWAGDVKVSFRDGLVTIVATDATPRQILSEWARVARVQVTNLDRLAGAPLTLQLIEVPQARALETLLRGSAGYVAVPAGATSPPGAVFDRILLMPGAAPATVSLGSTGPRLAQSSAQYPSQSIAPPATETARPRPPAATGDDKDVGSSPGGGSTSAGLAPSGSPAQPQAGYPGMPIFIRSGTPSNQAFDYANPPQIHAATPAPPAGSSVPGVAASPSALAAIAHGSPAVPAPPAGSQRASTPGTSSSGTPVAGSKQPGSAAPAPGGTLDPYGLPLGERAIQKPLSPNPYGLPADTRPPAQPIKGGGPGHEP